jgi:hypothetical protein
MQRPTTRLPFKIPIPTGLLLLSLGLIACSIASSQPPPGPQGPGNIAQVWANDGGDKVTRDELRATHQSDSVFNDVWDGTGVALFGARNEVVAFNLVLEAPTSEANDVTVSLASLSGPEGTEITTHSANGDEVFDYVGRNIELFLVRYLEMNGVSTDLFFAGYDYDERHIPERCRRPHDANGEGSGDWTDRPCHNKLYPEIAVPLELASPFTIAAGTNQSIWGDITIPKTAAAGTYHGTIEIREGGTLSWQIPIALTVRDFTLPDLPTAKTMVIFSYENIGDRYLGEAYPTPGTPAYAELRALADEHFQLAHRHKLSLIGNVDGYTPIEEMDEAWLAQLSGSLFTEARGYGGLGEGLGNNVYAIGEYGGWPWQDADRAEMWRQSDAWVSWFDTQSFTTPTDYFLYLIDESEDYPQIEQWAQWIESNPGPGRRLMSMATIPLPSAANTPSLDIIASWVQFGVTDVWQAATDDYEANPDKHLYLYNSGRPGSGSFAIEDDGVALRELAWGQYKKGIERWFYWESTYYQNYQCYGEDPEAYTNVFEQAQTYGCLETNDPVLGETGWNYLNGDGVLFYPGTDRRFPLDSYGVKGPFASLRLKYWRRGIQDVDYLSLAAQVDVARTTGVIERMIPKVLWEVGVTDPDDPTWVLSDISWPIDPDVWEAARAELADIIEGGHHDN